ncbi:MAG TPA: hypothetical protein VGG44_06615 [Tepidisphaeraceae bacterium]
MRRGHFWRLTILLPVLFVISVCINGCSTDEGTLHLASLDGQRQFSQNFSQAYISWNQTGDADVVMVEDQIQPSHSDPTKPLAPDRWRTPRQLVHIRIFWMPMSGVKPDHPANTNASIHWCLLSNGPDGSGVVEYQGSGLVELDSSSNGATVTIRKAWMKAGRQQGQLIDPMGPSVLQGTFHAASDTAAVKAIIAEIKAAGSNDQAKGTAPVIEQPKTLAVDPGN